MRYLAILVFLFSATAQSEVHECVTRKPAIEARYDVLCPLAEKYARSSGAWTDKKCATFFFEGGLRVFSNRIQQEIRKELQRVKRCEDNNRELAEFEGIEPDDCSPPPPTPSPTQMPTPMPTPQP